MGTPARTEEKTRIYFELFLSISSCLWVNLPTTAHYFHLRMPRIRGASHENSRGSGSSCCTLFFFFTSLVELVIILHLIGTKTLHLTESLHGNEHNDLTAVNTRPSSVSMAVAIAELPTVNPTTSPTCSSVAVTSAPPALEGVAVTLFLHSPTWFQRRNSIMVNLVRGNLPPRWKVQIFWMGHGQSKNAIDINPGVKRLIDSGDVILTRIPDDILEKKQKKKMIHLMTEEWIWQNMAAPKVLLFGGNNVICTNSPYRITDFSHWDYIGAPWNTFHGMGGEGAISIRSRDAMLAAIKYATSKLPPEEVPLAYLKWIPDDHFFVKTMLEMNKKKLANFKIADRNATLTFAAIGSAANSDVLVASGTLPSLTFKERDKFMLTCPELKTLYPSLHEPACFGAAPNGTKCKASICALEEPKRRGGC